MTALKRSLFVISTHLCNYTQRVSFCLAEPIQRPHWRPNSRMLSDKFIWDWYIMIIVPWSPIRMSMLKACGLLRDLSNQLCPTLLMRMNSFDHSNIILCLNCRLAIHNTCGACCTYIASFIHRFNFFGNFTFNIIRRSI